MTYKTHGPGNLLIALWIVRNKFEPKVNASISTSMSTKKGLYKNHSYHMWCSIIKIGQTSFSIRYQKRRVMAISTFLLRKTDKIYIMNCRPWDYLEVSLLDIFGKSVPTRNLKKWYDYHLNISKRYPIFQSSRVLAQKMCLPHPF